EGPGGGAGGRPPRSGDRGGEPVPGLMRLALVLLAACATQPAPVVTMISANAEWKALPPPADLHDSPYGAWFVRSIGGTDVVFFHGGGGRGAAPRAPPRARQLSRPPPAPHPATRAR